MHSSQTTRVDFISPNFHLPKQCSMELALQRLKLLGALHSYKTSCWKHVILHKGLKNSVIPQAQLPLAWCKVLGKLWVESLVFASSFMVHKFCIFFTSSNGLTGKSWSFCRDDRCFFSSSSSFSLDIKDFACSARSFALCLAYIFFKCSTPAPLLELLSSANFWETQENKKCWLVFFGTAFADVQKKEKRKF